MATHQPRLNAHYLTLNSDCANSDGDKLPLRAANTMPTIIRQALSDRIRRLPALQEFLRDFRLATGVPVEFVGSLGHRAPDMEVGALCGLLHQTPNGCRLCTQTVQQLLEQSASGPVQMRCDAGLCESAVALRGGGQIFGYFLFGGYFTADPDLSEKNRIRHLFDRLGAKVDQTSLDGLCARSPRIGSEQQASLLRILKLAASHLILAITDNLSAPSEKLPPVVQNACDQARRTFMHEVSLREIARKSSVTAGYLCRVFHKATGLRFREYVGRLRAEYARSLLLTTDRSITDIAFASGFQSISQFNRVFRSIHGTSPNAMRLSKDKVPAKI